MTPDQVKKKFALEGRTFAAWATEHGYRRHDVYRVLNGLTKATALEYAQMGIKPCNFFTCSRAASLSESAVASCRMVRRNSSCVITCRARAERARCCRSDKERGN